MLNKWHIQPASIFNQINFQWIVLYKYLFHLILINVPNLTNSTVFRLTSQILHTSSLFMSNPQPSLRHISKPNLNRTVNFKTYFKTPSIRNTKSFKVITYHKNSFYNLFLLYIQYTTGTLTHFFTPHTNFKAFFLVSFHNKASYINILKVFSRWSHISNFIINLFSLDIDLNVFTNKTLKYEALSFNWSHNLFNYHLFKYTSPIFFLKDTTFGTNSTLIFKKLHQRGLNTVFLTDLKYHEKNLYYLKRFNMTTIGLVPYNLNPWLVTYAIPTSTNSLFIQYFFVKLLIHYKQFSLQTKFINYKKLW